MFSCATGSRPGSRGRYSMILSSSAMQKRSREGRSSGYGAGAGSSSSASLERIGNDERREKSPDPRNEEVSNDEQPGARRRFPTGPPRHVRRPGGGEHRSRRA